MEQDSKEHYELDGLELAEGGHREIPKHRAITSYQWKDVSCSYGK